MKNSKNVLLALLLTTGAAHADLGDKLERTWEESTGISKVYGGFTSEATNFALSHERREGALGVDVLLMQTGDNGENAVGQADEKTMLGASLIHHLQDNSRADVYLGTGIAATYQEDINSTDQDETTYGPLFRIGSSYYLNNEWSVGLEYMAALNWTSDKLPSESTYGFLTLGYTY